MSSEDEKQHWSPVLGIDHLSDTSSGQECWCMNTCCWSEDGCICDACDCRED